MDYYVVDAFTDKVFRGNPAGVCILEHAIAPELMQNIAAENCLSETAFVVSTTERGEYDLRWFTPVDEIDLCGHATLASAHVLYTEVNPSLENVLFHTMSGDIGVKKQQSVYEMVLPRRELNMLPMTVELRQDLTAILGTDPKAAGYSRDIVIEVKDIEAVRNLTPDFAKMLTYVQEHGYLGMVVTAPVRQQSELKAESTEQIDFVSRYFCPELESKEDPVTGSSHSNLIPYWSERLGKKKMTALQLSKRTGILYCVDQPKDHVLVSGKASSYLKGYLMIGE